MTNHYDALETREPAKRRAYLAQFLNGRLFGFVLPISPSFRKCSSESSFR